MFFQIYFKDFLDKIDEFQKSSSFLWCSRKGEEIREIIFVSVLIVLLWSSYFKFMKYVCC